MQKLSAEGDSFMRSAKQLRKKEYFSHVDILSSGGTCTPQGSEDSDMVTDDEANAMSLSQRHDVMMPTAKILGRNRPELEKIIEAEADALLGPDYTDASTAYMRRYRDDSHQATLERQRMQEEDTKIKTLHPGTNFHLGSLGGLI
jgi:hypothetical protein